MNAPPRPKRRRYLTWPIAALVVVCLFLALHAAWMHKVRRQTDDLLQAWRNLGLPAGPEELEAWSDRPVEGANAADLYDEAFVVLVDPDHYAISDFRSNGAGAGEESVAYARNHVATNAPALAWLARATEVPEYVRPVEFVGGEFRFNDSIQEALRSARLLGDAAALAAMDGDWPAFERYLDDMLALGRNVRTEPILISQLVGIAIESIALARVEDALNTETMPGELAGGLAARLGQSDTYPETMASSMAGEMCFQQTYYGREVSGFLDVYRPFGTDNTWIIRLLGLGYTLSGIQDLDHLRLLELDLALYRALRAEPGTVRARLADVEREIEAISPVLLGAKGVGDGVIPAIYRSLEVSAGMRVAKVGLAVHALEQDRGTPPANLQDLVPRYLPSLPLDPYTNTNLLYRTNENGYVVYSAGKNGTDDGGAEHPPSFPGPEDDVVFRVERSPGGGE